MNEKTFAKKIKQEINEAGKEFENFSMPISIDYINEQNLNYNILVKEIEKLGLKTELSENIKSLKKQLKKPYLVIYRTNEDL